MWQSNWETDSCYLMLDDDFVHYFMQFGCIFVNLVFLGKIKYLLLYICVEICKWGWFLWWTIRDTLHTHTPLWKDLEPFLKAMYRIVLFSCIFAPKASSLLKKARDSGNSICQLEAKKLTVKNFRIHSIIFHYL